MSVRILKTLSHRYDITIAVERINDLDIRYTVDWAGENPKDFWISDYEMDTKKTKKAVVEYLEQLKKKRKEKNI